ncbi:MAG TPA: helix-turn-helix domain-containing protein [Candidatus Marinimicrobia bacterium]|nr:helix-turn-helix domain-containing protein [Candidatus Neomarinimicrobiota bacterium]HQH56667.1 helix-turn-helix domain-containing protein [Candidatus Neomarinimicrobiota bacterium]
MSDLVFKEIVERLDRLESQIKPEYPAWLSVKQCASYLDVSESTIRKLVASGNIPYRRLPTGEGGAIRFNRKQIDLWLLSGDVKPKARTRATFEALL